MLLYIDPSTGSMLFTVLLGILGAVIYALRALFIKLQVVFYGGKDAGISKNSIPIAIYSDDKRYWTTFRPICHELEKRGQDAVYLTASQDDPCFQEEFQHIQCQFIGEGNKGFAKLNLLKADILLSTTPGLDVYQWKRSKDVKYYVHIVHMANDALYRMYGLDYYDAVLLSGDFQCAQIRELEDLRSLPPKELKIVGVPYLDELNKRLKNTPEIDRTGKTVLLAPTWGTTGALTRYGNKIIQALLDTGYHIIIRPHPQSFSSEKDMLSKLMTTFPESSQLEWNQDVDNFDALNRADVMISDFSGVIFDYSLVFNKPLLYLDISYNKAPYDSYWIKEEMWTLTTLPKIGYQLTLDDMDHLKEKIDSCISSTAFRQGIDQARKECWNHIGDSAKLTADYLIAKRNEILKEENSEHAV